LALAFGLSLVLGASSVTAQSEGNEAIRLTFAAPPACPDEQAFTAELRARTSRARLAWPGEPARTFRVTITRNQGATLGNLTIEETGGSSAVREVTGKTCPEVVSALALVMALAIDPHALTTIHPPAAETGPKDMAASAPPSLPWWVGLPSDLGPPRLRLLDVDPEHALAAPPLPVWIGPPHPELHGFRATAGTMIIGHGAIGPDLEPGAQAFIDIGRRETDLLEPSFRFSVISVAAGTFASGAGTASLHYEALQVDGCPIQVALETFVRFYPCATFEVGSLQGQGNGSISHENVTRPWAAAGLIGRSSWRIVDHLYLELQGGLNFPFVRDTFLLGGATKADSTLVYAVPTVGGTVGAGLGVRFP
jgi:hypothetical protein